MYATTTNFEHTQQPVAPSMQEEQNGEKAERCELSANSNSSLSTH